MKAWTPRETSELIRIAIACQRFKLSPHNCFHEWCQNHGYTRRRNDETVCRCRIYTVSTKYYNPI